MVNPWPKFVPFTAELAIALATGAAKVFVNPPAAGKASFKPIVKPEPKRLVSNPLAKLPPPKAVIPPLKVPCDKADPRASAVAFTPYSLATPTPASDKSPVNVFVKGPAKPAVKPIDMMGNPGLIEFNTSVKAPPVDVFKVGAAVPSAFQIALYLALPSIFPFASVGKTGLGE